jgi:hypothetical protein
MPFVQETFMVWTDGKTRTAAESGGERRRAAESGEERQRAAESGRERRRAVETTSGCETGDVRPAGVTAVARRVRM